MKKLLAMLLALTMLLSLVSCGKDTKEKQDAPDITPPDGIEDILDSDSDEEDTSSTGKEDTSSTEEKELRSKTFVIPDTDAEQEGSIDLASRNYMRVALNFVAAIAQNYYTSAIAGFDIEESPFITAEDIAYAVPRSTFKDIANFAGKEVYLLVDEEASTSNDETAFAVVEMRTNDDEVLNSYNLNLRLNKDNKWTVVDSNFYETDYYVAAPGNVTLYINDTEVSKELFDHKVSYNGYMDCYKIPLIGKSVKNLKIVCETFEEQVEAVPATNNSEDPFSVNCFLVDTELNDALNATKTLWESLYNDYINGVPEAEWLKYFSANAPATYVNDIKNSFDDLTKNEKNHRITQLQERSDADCFYLTDKVFVLNIQYQIDGLYGITELNKKGRRYSHILLTIENGEYKIFEVSDMELFRESLGSDW